MRNIRVGEEAVDAGDVVGDVGVLDLGAGQLCCSVLDSGQLRLVRGAADTSGKKIVRTNDELRRGCGPSFPMIVDGPRLILAGTNPQSILFAPLRGERRLRKCWDDAFDKRAAPR